MSRFGQFATAFVLAIACGERAAWAQPPVTSEYPWSAQIDVAATVGHRSSASIGGEVDYNVRPDLEVFLEAGRMNNVATSELDRRATIVGDFIGATSKPVQRAIYADVGVRYNLRAIGLWHPFLAAGFGLARLHTETAFVVGSTTLTPSDLADSYGVELGLDLDGRVTKPFFMIGGGVNVPVKRRYFVEGTYRYGRIFARTSQIEDDTAINAQRVQVGFGVRF